jgi:hypothetical protein
MSLITPVPPVACAAAFSAQLPMFLHEASGVVKQNYLGKPTVPTLAEVGSGTPVPQQVFLLSLNEAANNTGTINPPAVGWRFFVGSSPGATVLGRMVQIAPSNTWKLTGVFYGQRVAQALAASYGLGSLPQVQAADYELRLLAVPGLNLEAFWLAAQKAGSVDFIIPFPASTGQVIQVLQSPSPYQMMTFLFLIRSLAAASRTMAAGYGA